MLLRLMNFTAELARTGLSCPTTAFGAALLGVAFLWMAMKLTACRSNLAARHLLQGSILYLPLVCALLPLAKEHSM